MINSRFIFGVLIATSLVGLGFALPVFAVNPSVTLTALPSSGSEPLNVTLTGDVKNSRGTIYWYFWWDCPNPTGNLTQAISACGSPPPAPLGGCSIADSIGYSCSAIPDTLKSVSHTYVTAGAYTAKVIVLPSLSLFSAEDRTTITVSSPTPTPTPSNRPPTVSNVRIVEPDYCTSGPAITVLWDYSDPDGDPQRAFQVQVDAEGNSFKKPPIDCKCSGGAWGGTACVYSGGCDGSAKSFYSGSGILEFNKTYQARIRVSDSAIIAGAFNQSLAFSNSPSLFANILELIGKIFK